MLSVSDIDIGGSGNHVSTFSGNWRADAGAARQFPDLLLCFMFLWVPVMS